MESITLSGRVEWQDGAAGFDAIAAKRAAHRAHHLDDLFACGEESFFILRAKDTNL